MHHRLRASITLAFLATALAGPTAAQSPAAFPSKPVRVVIPFPAGTSPDIIVRLMGPHLNAAWGQPMVVENRTGASGSIGAKAAATAAPDGHTVLYTINSVIVGNPHLYAKLSYDPLKDFIPVSQAVTLGYVLLARTDHAAKTLPEMIALAKASPGKYNFASNGSGSGPHIVMEMFNRAAGITLNHIPMNTPGATAVMTGEVDFVMNPVTTAAPLVAGGKLRGLGVTMPTRIASVPNVPAIGEFVPGYAADAWHGFFAPAGTPMPIVEKLSADFARALSEPDVKKRLTELGLDVIGSTPKAFAAVVKSDYDKWGEVVRAANIKLD